MKIISLDYRVYFIYGFVYIFMLHTHICIFICICIFLVQQILRVLKIKVSQQKKSHVYPFSFRILQNKRLANYIKYCYDFIIKKK